MDTVQTLALLSDEATDAKICDTEERILGRDAQEVHDVISPAGYALKIHMALTFWSHVPHESQTEADSIVRCHSLQLRLLYLRELTNSVRSP